MLGFLFAMMAQITATPIAATPTCVLDEAGKRANAKLSFSEFDQAGVLPSTARKLGEAGCWSAAAEATSDYLVRGPVPTPREQRILLFHLGQSLALGGEERRAATYIAATREPADARKGDVDPLNWNDYVVGTWAFLMKNRSTLVSARDAVLARPGRGNATNGAILGAMERCFAQAYAVAYDPNCGR